MTTPPETTPKVTPEPPPLRPWRALTPLVIMALVLAAGYGVVKSATWVGGAVTDALESRAEGVVNDVTPGLDVQVEIPAGATGAQIAEILSEAGVVRSARQFESAVDTAGVANSLKAGSFDLVTGMNPDAAINVLIAGPTIRVFDITVREGLRVTEILDVLTEESGIARAEFEQALLSGVVTTTVHTIPDEATLANWEGLLFPDTYEFSEISSASDILNRMARTMAVRMDSVDWSAFEAAGFSRYEGIVIASLIESEVQVADERPLVASVIRNRLEIGEILGLDASTLYAQGTRQASEIDVDFDSPYNTRRYAGLPPGPISAPGLASLTATAVPAESSFLYYVLADENGSHVFAETLEEHNANVEISREAGLLG